MVDEAFGVREEETEGAMSGRETEEDEGQERQPQGDPQNTWWWGWSWGGHHRGSWETDSQRSNYQYGRIEQKKSEFTPY